MGRVPLYREIRESREFTYTARPQFPTVAIPPMLGDIDEGSVIRLAFISLCFTHLLFPQILEP
jgi:hypothetical protein